MKPDDFIHLLTRVVNSKGGPRFLEILHELREVLEDAGIAEEAGPRLEPGKPLRRRAPEEIAKRVKEAPPVEPPAAEAPPAPEAEISSPREEAPSPGESTLVAAQEAGPAAPIPEPLLESSEGGSEFIEAEPNRFIRKTEAPEGPSEPQPETEPPAAAEPPPKTEPAPKTAPFKGPRRESVRSLVLDALKEGDKSLQELRDHVRGKKSRISSPSQQVQAALRKINAGKTPEGKFTLSGGDENWVEEVEPEEEKLKAPRPHKGLKQLSLLDQIAAQSKKEAGPPGERPGDGTDPIEEEGNDIETADSRDPVT